MSVVTVSRGYRIVIPKDVRERLGIELLPCRSPGELRGLLRGSVNSFERAPDRV